MADASALAAQAQTLLDERALDFLTPKQKAEFNKKQLDKAERKCREALKLDAALPVAHQVLGAVLEARGDLGGAAASFTAAMEAAGGANAEPATAAWATAASRAYAVLVRCAEAARPAWWADETLLALSERAVAALPESALAHTWRAELLSGLQPALPPRAAARSAEQHRAAAAHHQKVAALAPDKEAKKAAAAAAAECLTAATRAEKQPAPGAEDAEAAADEGAGTASSKNAAKNRKKKEKAKAKLAEKLLSEVEAAEGSAAAKAESKPAAAEGAAAAGGRTGYRWADPLPEGWVEALSELSIVAGAPVSQVDLQGMAAEGGPAESVAVGLIVADTVDVS